MRGLKRAPKDRGGWSGPPDRGQPAAVGARFPGAARVPRTQGAAAVVGLLCLIALVSLAGVLVGRGLVKVQHPAASATGAAPVAAAAAAKVRAASRWGPFRVAVVGRLAPGLGGAAALAAGRLLVVGGPSAEIVYGGRVGQRLSRLGALGSPRANASAYAVGASVYLLGGERGTAPSDLITRIGASGQLSSAGVFEEPIAESGLAPADGGAYLVGGWTGQKYATAILKLGASGAVQLIARLPNGLRFPAVALLGDRLYVAGGRSQAGLSRRIYAIDIRSGSLRSLGELPSPVEQAVLVVSGPALYLLGGRNTRGAPLSSIVKIDPATGATTAAGRMPRPLAGAIAVRAGARTLVLAPGLGLVYRLR